MATGPFIQKGTLKKKNRVVYPGTLFLKTASTKAVETLAALLSEDDPRVKLNAADKILAHALKGVEYLGFEERLGEAEARLECALNTKHERTTYDTLEKIARTRSLPS